MLLCTPIDGIWGVVAIERPDVGGKGGGIHVEVGDSSHMCAMPFLEVDCASSISFHFSSVCSCYTEPVHYITIYALIWHWTVGLVPAITCQGGLWVFLLQDVLIVT